MKEMLLVGRGGEGVVLASQILADTLARAGGWVQAFPEFTAERRGAPISAFVRWDQSSPIRRRYKIHDCDVLVVISPAPPADEVVARVRPGGLIVLNRDARLQLAGPFTVARVAASRIARKHGVMSSEGRPMGNAAVLGACVRLLAPNSLDFLADAIGTRVRSHADANVAAAREGYASCTTQHTQSGDHRASRLAPSALHVPPLFAMSTADSRGRHTGTWSLDRPVLADACTACALCALFCPEGAITRHDGSMFVDERYCKGCGICEVVCPVRGAIVMEEVRA